MEALTEFSFRARMRDITNMRVSVTASSGELDEILQINEKNLDHFQVRHVNIFINLKRHQAYVTSK